MKPTLSDSLLELRFAEKQHGFLVFFSGTKANFSRMSGG
jgi:hypothetical protein